MTHSRSAITRGAGGSASLPAAGGAPSTALWRQGKLVEANPGEPVRFPPRGLRERGCPRRLPWRQRARAVAVLDELALELVRHVVRSRHPVVDHVRVEELSALVDHLFEQGVTETLHDCAFVLRLALLRVDAEAHVGHGNVSLDDDGPCVLIDADLRGADGHFPEGRAPAEGGSAAAGRYNAATDELAASHAESFVEHRGVAGDDGTRPRSSSADSSSSKPRTWTRCAQWPRDSPGPYRHHRGSPGPGAHALLGALLGGQQRPAALTSARGRAGVSSH
jgi:hypothetical protein